MSTSKLAAGGNENHASSPRSLGCSFNTSLLLKAQAQSVAQSTAKCDDDDDSDGWSDESVDSVVVVTKEPEIENPPDKVQSKPQMNQVATMLTNLLSNRRSLETLQSYKKYCDPVIDDSDEEILTIEENTQAVDLPSLYDKYCNNNQELSIIEDSVSTASSYDLEEHKSDNLQVYQTDGDSEYEEEYQEDFDDGECGSSRCSYSGHDISAVQYGNERGSCHNQRNTGSCDEAYLHSETSHLSKAEGGEDADYDEDWVGDGQEEPDETSECASLCLSTASSCATSSNSSQSRMREERTQNIHYTLPPRQLMSSSSPPVRIAASMKRKNFDNTQIRPSYLTKRSPHLDCSSSTEFILLSRRPCYRSTHTTHRGTGACASVRCVTNQRDTIQTTGRLPNSVYVRASLTSTAAAARSSTHSPWREEAESAPSPSTVGHIYNSGKLEYLKKRISGLAYDKGRMHQTSSGRNIEDSLRRQLTRAECDKRKILDFVIEVIGKRQLEGYFDHIKNSPETLQRLEETILSHSFNDN